jgi:hypothetical protein
MGLCQQSFVHSLFYTCPAGSEAEIKRFLEMLRNRMSGKIDREEVQEFPASGEFSGFDVR